MFVDIRQDIGHRSKRALFDQCASRKHFITKQDISNVRVNIKDNAIIRHKSDPISVSLLVAELRQEAYDPILLFKPQGERSTAYPNLPSEGFVLVIQTQFQQQLFEKYSHKILCVDSTHGTNAYRFQLITCIVPDEFGKGMILIKYFNYVTYIVYEHIGQPIAWCIADGASGEIVAAFLKSIHERSPDSRVHVIMTDDGTYVHVSTT